MAWLAVALFAVALALVWSNHFQNSFHYDDFQRIVQNKAVQNLRNIPHFFSDPKTYSSLYEDASWQPLLSTTFAMDYWAARGNGAQIFLIETFAWFLLQIIFVYVLLRLLPGGNHVRAIFGAALLALHPVTADTVNYISQRGVVFGALGISMSLGAWIVWPRMLPRRINLGAPAVPKTDWEAFLIQTQRRIDAVWMKFIDAPLGFYLIPVAVAMFATPAAAAFPLILLAYVILLDGDKSPRDVIPAGIVCGLLWVIPTAFTLRFAAQVRPSLFAYWASQPLAVLHYLFTFVNPSRLAIDTGMQTVGWVGGLAGFAGLAMIVGLAVFAAGSKAWRPVSFGLWWFLLALVPDSLVPQRDLEAAPRMYIAMIGLIYAITSIAAILVARARQSEKLKLPVTAAMVAAGLVVVTALSLQTSKRNTAWDSEETIWQDAVDKNPLNGRALDHYARALVEIGADRTTSFALMKKAALLSPEDPSIELSLAAMSTRLGQPTEAEKHYKRIIAIKPRWAYGYAIYSRWLISQLRVPEAIEHANKALSLQYDQLDARHTLMDVYVVRHDWAKTTELAKETLRFDSGDEDAARAMTVVGLALNEIKAEESGASSLGREGYLSLSVTYFKNGRYDDCIGAARKALKLDPNLAEAWANIAAAYQALGKVDESVDASKEVVRLNPELPFAKSNLAYALAEQAKAHPDNDAAKP